MRIIPGMDQGVFYVTVIETAAGTLAARALNDGSKVRLRFQGPGCPEGFAQGLDSSAVIGTFTPGEALDRAVRACAIALCAPSASFED